MDIVVTTIQEPSWEIIDCGREIAKKLAVPFTPRGRTSLNNLKDQFHADMVLVATSNGPVVHTPGGEYFFHLSMAELRIKNIIIGKHDHMIDAMELAFGNSVLDCTLGLATDAIVANFVAGSKGRVVGLESSPVIALVTGSGLSRFILANDELKITESLRRIEVKNIDYMDYFHSLPDNSFDIVYFDPMFRQPVYRSSCMKPLRYLTDKQPVTVDAVEEAMRIAKKRVVIKDGRDSEQFAKLGINRFFGGKYSRIKYGIIHCDQSSLGQKVREAERWNA
ncbi:MAG TPA: class I SAM-dependent methyltransferase [Methylomusa anaerophila]|uniref:Putative methyltransferase n=1 Tax=Methylomusa anaerophila TaxID=1930071 RepID=A0A348APU8_9FIRM|nr:class I SAM-dependent methyltransferase [Methylomusa anaerophila]BBB93096.1 putative methyltransferase [Methylomusa anaerophila]HML87071.1 class I SAM-dependent methyltransferase [Methylomusa anaerophila]